MIDETNGVVCGIWNKDLDECEPVAPHVKYFGILGKGRSGLIVSMGPEVIG